MERSEDMEAEAVLAEMTVNRNQTRPFKVTNKARTRKVGVVACNYSELKCKCQEKFRSLEEDVTFVIESDGTEVDSDYLEMVHSEILMFLQGDENWEPVSCPASDHADQNSDITMSIMEKLREDNRRKRTQKPMLENKKKQISVHVGWMNYRFRDKKYHLIKGTGGNPDSGPRTIKLASQSNFKEIQEFLRSTFFPNRRSFLGVEKRFQFSVGNFDGQEINEDTKLYQFIGSSTKPRIYLLSKEIPRSFDQQTDSDTDSDFLPDIRPPKRIRTHTVSSQEASGYSQDTAQTSSQAFSVSPPAVSHNLAFTPKSTSSLNTLGLTTHIPVINFEEYIQRPVVPQTTENNMNEAPVQPIRLQMQAGTPTMRLALTTCKLQDALDDVMYSRSCHYNISTGRWGNIYGSREGHRGGNLCLTICKIFPVSN